MISSKIAEFLYKSFKVAKSVDLLLERFFRWYGYILYEFKWLFFVAPIIFCGFASTGFIFMNSLTKNETEYLFTPFDGLSVYEKAVINEQFPSKPGMYIPGKYFDTKMWIDVVTKAKDKGNLLRPDYIDALIEFNNYVMHNFTVESFDRKFNLTYQDLCLTWEDKCFENEHIDLMKDVKSMDKFVNITYPITHKGDVSVYLASSYGGVNVIDDTGRFNIVTAVRTSYDLVETPGDAYYYAFQWRSAFQDYIINYQSAYLDVGVYHSDAINSGLQEIADKFVPDFALTFMVLASFAVCCSFVLMRDKTNAVDWVRSKPGLAVIGIISAGMAISSAMGLLFLGQQEYNKIVCTMPFLAISIGVNDMFIMTNGWHRTKLTDPLPERMSAMMSEAAVAITITSFTDVISFAIGMWNSLRGVITFCQFTCIALLMDYLYQITFYSAAIAIYGDMEQQGRHCLFYYKMKPLTKSTEKLTFWQKYFLSGTVPDQTTIRKSKYIGSDPCFTLNPEPGTHDHQRAHSDEEHEAVIDRIFRKYYGPFLMKPKTKFVVVVAFFVYLGFAGYGCYHIKDGLQPDKLVLRSHFVTKYFDLISDFWAEGMQAHIVVNNPPNFTIGAERDKFLLVVHRFENTRHTLARNATIFFLYEYINYLDGYQAKIKNTTDMWEDGIKDWIDYTGGRSLWLTDIRWGDEWAGENPNRMKAIRFQVGIRNFETPNDHMATMDLLRSIAALYPEYNITTYHEYWPYADQYEMTKPTMLRDNITAIFTMLIIAMILIPNLLCGIFITVAMITINIGVYGFMSLWHVNLDGVSMITLIMAIGFAIDLSCHISYGYICAKGTPTERTVAALEQLGWPVFQGAMATILGTLVLAAVDSYMIQTFFKTVFLVILFGLLHSVVFLPVALALLLPEKKIECVLKRHAKVGTVIPDNKNNHNNNNYDPNVDR